MDNIKFIANVTKQNYGFKQTMQNNDVTLEITPIVDGKYLNLSGAIISLNWLKPDNQLISIAGSSITIVGSNVLVVLPKDCTSIPGEVKFELVITQSNKQVSAFPLSLNVGKSVYQGIVGSTSFATVVQDINEANVSALTTIGQMEQTKQDVQNLITNGGAVRLTDYAYGLDTFVGTTGNEKLTSAITFLNGTNGTIVISNNYNIALSITIPNNITLKFTQGGLLTVTDTKKLTINGNIDAGIFQIFSCTAGDILLPNLKQEAYPQWFGAKGDRVTNDQNSISAIVYSQCPVIRVPNGVYQAYFANGFSNRTFIFDEGAIIDGVVHLATGKGPGVEPVQPTVDYVENIRVIGTLSSTVRIGTYYCRNINIDKIHLVPTNPIYVNQTTEGGQKGNHFTSGTENLTIGEQIIDGTTNLTYALGIDKYPLDTVNLAKNFKFGKVTINNCETAGISIVDMNGLTIDTLTINSYDKYSNNLSNSANIKIGKIYVNGSQTTTTNLFGLFATNVTNMTIDEIITEYNSTGYYINGCINPLINKATANNNTGKGMYFYNDTNAYLGIANANNNGAEGIYFKTPILAKQLFAYNNGSMGVEFDGSNGCSNSKVDKIVAYNNNNYNVFLSGVNNYIGETLAYNPIGAKYSINISSSTNCKIDFIETYGAVQGLRFLSNTNFFSRFIYTHNNTTGVAMDASSNGVFIDYVKYATNTTDISGGTINATVITT